MNDFTKENLNDLNVLLCLWVVKHPEDIGTRELQKKIQSMIDNYCEQESIDELDLFLPRVGAILTDEKISIISKLYLIKELYLKTVWPDKYGKENFTDEN